MLIYIGFYREDTKIWNCEYIFASLSVCFQRSTAKNIMSYWFHMDTGSKIWLQNSINFSTWAGQLQAAVIALLPVLHVPISKIKENVGT